MRLKINCGKITSTYFRNLPPFIECCGGLSEVDLGGGQGIRAKGSQVSE